MAREMKDCGIEWIGEIPLDWFISKFKQVSNLYNGNSIRDEEKASYEDSNNAIPYIATKDIDVTNSSANYENGMYTKIDDRDFKVAKKNSVLLCIEGGSAGRKITYLYQDVSFVNKLCCFEPLLVNPKYQYYYLQSPVFIEEFKNNLSGLIGGVSVGKLKNFNIILPPFETQQRIADYLDEMCKEIDSVIESTKATIEEYKKYKQSIITEAVTKGLNPNAEMKDSGIEWVGQIPKHWDIYSLTQVFDRVKCKNSKMQETNLLSLSYGRIIQKDINTTGGLLPENFEGYNIIENGDIVLRLTDLQNDHTSLRVGLATQRGIITSAYITIRNQSKYNSEYLYYYLHSFDIYKGFYGMGSGVRQGLTYDGIKYLKFALPTRQEQDEIVKYLKSMEEQIDNLILQKHQILKELESYKKSLIYECVTGKRDVSVTERILSATIIYPLFPALLATDKKRFAQAVLVSKIIDSANNSLLGRVKLEKMLYTIETHIGFDFHTDYKRQIAGPLDDSIYQCEGVISQQNKWFNIHKNKNRVKYSSAKDMAKYKRYYKKYFADYNSEIERIIDIFRSLTKDESEIIATLYAAWNDLIIGGKDFTDEDIVEDVLNNWHDSKKRFSKEVWLNKIQQMRELGLVPKGYGKKTTITVEV